MTTTTTLYRTGGATVGRVCGPRVTRARCAASRLPCGVRFAHSGYGIMGTSRESATSARLAPKFQNLYTSNQRLPALRADSLDKNRSEQGKAFFMPSKGAEMAVSRGKRFDLFKRDGFTCQYCGRRPPEVVLEIDHIEPVSKGGDDDPINLITSCYDCNRGKHAKRLGDKVIRPDADAEFYRVQQEIAEAKRYMEARAERETVLEDLFATLDQVWADNISDEDFPTTQVWRRWLATYTPDQIERTVIAVSRPYHAGRIRGGFGGLMRYMGGTLKAIGEEDAEAS
jgi:hypothetical protein